MYKRANYSRIMPSPIRFAWPTQRQARPIVLQIKLSHSSSHAALAGASLPLCAHACMPSSISHTHRTLSVVGMDDSNMYLQCSDHSRPVKKVKVVAVGEKELYFAFSSASACFLIQQ